MIRVRGFYHVTKFRYSTPSGFWDSYMYCLRLFNKNYIVYYNVYCYYCGVFIETYVYAKFRLDWLLRK